MVLGRLGIGDTGDFGGLWGRYANCNHVPIVLMVANVPISCVKANYHKSLPPCAKKPRRGIDKSRRICYHSAIFNRETSDIER